MKGILKYMRWLWSHSVGARGAVLANILLGTLNVGLNLLFIYLCKRLVDIATGAVQGSLDVYTAHIVLIYMWFTVVPNSVRYHLPWDVVLPLVACCLLWGLAKLREPKPRIQ